MSFSSDIKQELNKNSNLVNKEIVKYELIGYLISGNIDIQNNKTIKFSTESDYNINRFSKLLSNLNIEYNIEVIGKNFIVTVKINDLKNIDGINEIIKFNNNILLLDLFNNENNNDINIEILKQIKKEENLRAMIRGLFMGSGSINNPNNEYHLEIGFKEYNNAEKVIEIFKRLDIETKNMENQNKYFIYLKDGEEISKVLALIGANKAVLAFEDIRIQKEMRGKVNRLVNCKTANLNKTINASIEQISAIKKLQANGKFNKLDDNLKEIALLRIENPDMSLIDLGKLLKNPVGKSGVNYRLKKIMEMADE